jgi:membrane protease YdiL (CAAX protease family)
MDEIGSQPGESSAAPGPSGSHDQPPFVASSGPNPVFFSEHGLRAGWRFLAYALSAISLIFLLGFLLAPLEHKLHPPLWADLIDEASSVIAVMVPAIILGRLENRGLGDYGLPRVQAFGKLFWAGVLWGIAALSVLMLALRGFHAFYFGHLALHGVRILKFASFYAALFLLVGFFEEFSFRGYGLFTLTSGMGFWPSAFFLSVLFGGLHLANSGEAWVGALSAGLLGLFLCFTVRRTGSLWFAVGMHASWDWGESFLYSVPDSGGMSPGHLLNSSFHGPIWLTGGSVGPEGSLLVFAVVALTWVVFAQIYPATAVGQVRTPARV